MTGIRAFQGRGWGFFLFLVLELILMSPNLAGSDFPGGGPPPDTESVDPDDSIRVAGFKGDAGVDTDGDGKFDILEVGVEVETTRAGGYTHSAQILDKENNDIEFPGEKDLRLSVGKNLVRIRFDGRKIAATRKSGPFRVRNYSIYLSGNHHFMAHTTEEYRTQAYDISEFPTSSELSLVDRSPGENQRGVSVSTTVRFSFSQALDPRSVSQETISLRTAKGSVVSTEISSDRECKTIFLRPFSPLEPNQAYLVMVSNKIRDTEGRPLSRFYTWTFVTGS